MARRKLFQSAVTLVTMLVALCVSVCANAQTAPEPYPSKSIRVIIPYPPGGVADGLARTIAFKLTETWNQQVVIENRIGGNTLIGMEAGARAAPDGYTLLFSADQGLVMNPHLYEHLPYDPIKDYDPISLLASVSQVLCVTASLPAQNVEELIALAKSKPGKLSYASTGIASTTHLNTELLKSLAGIDVVHIPYKGGNQGLTDVVGGQVSMMIIATSLALPHIRSGRVRALAVPSAVRSALIPNVPTFAEAGLQGYEAQPWFGLLSRVGTPKEIIYRINKDVVAALKAPDLQGKFRTQGLDIVGSTPDEFVSFIKTENAKWSKIIKQTGVRLE